LDVSPAATVDKPAKEERRDRVLSEDEIQSFWFGLDKAVMSENVRIALKLCLVTAQRRAEIAGLRNSEIDGDWWTLPKERSKNAKPHRTYLSPLARNLIKGASGNDYVFPSPRADGPIQPQSLIIALARNRDRVVDGKLLFDMPRFTVHDLRRTAATRMAEIGIPRFDIAKVLNHTDQEVTAIYDHYAYDAEKKGALLKWGRRLQKILDGTGSEKVVRIS
jgi:integrase